MTDPFLFTISNVICFVNPQNGSSVLFTISRFEYTTIFFVFMLLLGCQLLNYEASV